MKKYFRAVCLVLSGIMLFSATACNSEDKNAQNYDDICTIRFSWWGGDERHTATIKAVELFESKYPDIHIEAEYGGWDGWTEKVTTQIAGGTAPDVMQINYDWLLRFSKDGSGFYDLNLLKDQLHIENYSDEVLDYGRRNNILNAIPVSLTGRSIFFNKTTFDEIGAEIPDSWDELIELGHIFEKYDSYPLDLDIQSGFTAWYLTVVYSQQLYGKEFITKDGQLNFTVEEIEQALDFYKMLENNSVVRTVKQRVNDDGNDALYQSSGFIDGSIAGMIEWGSAVGKYEQSLEKDKLVIGNLLILDDAEVSGWFIKPSLMYAINSDTKYPEECAKFLDFILNDEECACILETSRGIPASISAYNALEKNDMLNGLAYESYVQINSCNPVSISPYMELAEMRQCYNDAIESISYGVSDTHSAAVKMHDRIEKILDSFR